METTDYSGMFVYKDGHVDYFQTSEGRMYWDNNHHLFYAEYFIKDHLGNVRDVITTNPYYSNSIIQITDYYPFGLEIQEINASDNLQLYNSKELQTDAKLWWYDYGARFYDPQLGRWHSVDPIAETSRRWSPYTYCMNNPIRFIDPDGMEMTDFKDKKGNLILHVEDGSNAVFELDGTNHSDEYFKFTDEYSNQGGNDEVSVEGAIAGVQDYVTNNYEYCNKAVNFVGRTYESASAAQNKTVDNIEIVNGTSTASTITNDLASKVTPETSVTSAKESAAKGNLVVGVNGSHVVTMTTKTFDITRYNASGSVIEQKQIVGGQITNVNGSPRPTNIGPNQKNSFQPPSFQKDLIWYSLPRK
jgi:RHS repeat-associated protein